jgi:hypothetical protein
MLKGEVRWFGKRLDTQFTQLKIVPISDLHYGNPLCSLKHFQFTIDFLLKNDDAFTYLNGDLLEAVTLDSKGDIFEQKYTPQKQRDDVIDLLKPIKHKILGMVSGNHEARVYRKVGMDISSDIAQVLGVPYRADGMVLKVMFGCGNNRMPSAPYVFWGYTTHGFGGARTKSAKAVKVERAAAWMPSADFVTMSHDHVVNVSPDVDLIPDKRGTEIENGFLSGKVTAHRKMLIKTNAYLKFGGYAESGGFPPTDLATPIIYLLTPQSKFWENYPGEPKKSVRVLV